MISFRVFPAHHEWRRRIDEAIISNNIVASWYNIHRAAFTLPVLYPWLSIGYGA